MGYLVLLSNIIERRREGVNERKGENAETIGVNLLGGRTILVVGNPYFCAMKIRLLCLLWLFGGAISAMGQMQQVIGKTTYPFWLNMPKEVKTDSLLPILVFLHGRSLSGNDLNKVKRYGVLQEIGRGRKIPGIVVAPQVKVGQSWEPDKILEVIRYVQSQYATDSTRIYVMGMSLGGYGTLHFAGKYPEKVAGAVALCGGGNPSDGCRLADVPLWIQHGKLDQAVPIAESEKMVKAIQDCNGGKCLTYKVHEKWGHGDLYRIFEQDGTYDWLFSQRKAQNGWREGGTE